MERGWGHVRVEVSSRHGSILIAAIAATLLLSAVATVSTYVLSRQKSTTRFKAESKKTIIVRSAIETFLLSYRFYERWYVQNSFSCVTYNPFYKAFVEGRRCMINIAPAGLPPNIVLGNSSFRMFDDSIFMPSYADPHGDKEPNVGPQTLYSYVAGCNVNTSDSNCSRTSPPLIELKRHANGVDHRIDGHSFEFLFSRVDQQRQTIEFLMVDVDPGGKRSTHRFEVDGGMGGTAHLEVDGRITQSGVYNDDLCSDAPWSKMLLYNPTEKKCLPFVSSGSTRSLHTYMGRYFTVRPYDGSLIDLTRAGATGGTLSATVSSTGHLPTGEKVHPSFNPDYLWGADDMTSIGHELYFVRGQGTSAKLMVQLPTSVMGFPAGTLYKVCDIGAALPTSYPLSYSGLAATQSSDPLFSPNSLDRSRLAIFQLKADQGQLLNVEVYMHRYSYYHQCRIQPGVTASIEFERTFGYDRIDSGPPYRLEN
jgi:hypothetical protein